MNRLDTSVKKTSFPLWTLSVVLRCLIVIVLIVLSAKTVVSQTGATIGRRYADLPQPPAQTKTSTGLPTNLPKSSTAVNQPRVGLPSSQTVPAPRVQEYPLPDARVRVPNPNAGTQDPSLGTQVTNVGPQNPSLGIQTPAIGNPSYPSMPSASTSSTLTSMPKLPPLPNLNNSLSGNQSGLKTNNAVTGESSSAGLPPVHPTMNSSDTASPVPNTLVSFNKSDSLIASDVDSVAFEPAQLVAVVGTDRILAGDMYTYVEPIIEQNRDKLTSKKQEDAVRTQLTRQVLKQYVEVKALYQEFFRDASGNAPPNEVETMRKTVVVKASKIFYEKQVPNLLKKYEVSNVAELEDKLREKSMSLLSLRTQFIEQVLSNELEHKYVPDEFEISSEEILEYYVSHRSEWDIPTRAKWRQLTIRFDRHPDRAAAEQLIKSLGNQIFLGGKSFEAVAKQSSEGFTAQDGGAYDWTTLGSLKSKTLEQAIFTLPVQRLSQVIEDDVGFHIIEVLEREEAQTRDMASSQAEIRTKLSNQKRNQAAKEFREKIMKRTPIWTLWPEDIPGSRALSVALGDSNSP